MGVQGDVFDMRTIVIQPFVTKMCHILTQPAYDIPPDGCPPHAQNVRLSCSIYIQVSQITIHAITIYSSCYAYGRYIGNTDIYVRQKPRAAATRQHVHRLIAQF